MLTTSGKKLDQRYDAVTVTDYFGETPQEVRIELDPAITLRENIDRMFKRQQKAGRGKQIVARQLAEVRSRAACNCRADAKAAGDQGLGYLARHC